MTMNFRILLPALAAASIAFASCSGSKKEAAAATPGTADSVEILYRAFSHNDATRPNPLKAALGLGFNCVEADCFIVEGDRLVLAHDLPADSAGRAALPTLQETYFEPLFARIDSIGTVYPGAEKPFYLMIDIKTDGDRFYTALRPYLESHARYFTRTEGDSVVSGPILLFFSGSRPMGTLLPTQPERMAFFDGNFGDLHNPSCTPALYPVVSDNYENFFTWNGEGTMPADQRAQLDALVAEAHAKGQLIRLWGAPDTEAWAKTQIEAGVDLIGTDNLPALHKLLTSKP